MNCPVCGGRATGRVGVEQYYCWDCCVEFSNASDQVVVYDLAEDGTLMAWDDWQGWTLDEEIAETAMES